MACDVSQPVAPVCLLVLSGLPAAGKSELAAALSNTKTQPFSPPVSVRVISFDDFLHQDQPSQDEFSPGAWQVSRAAALDHVKQVLQTPGTAVSESGLEPQHTVRRLLAVVDDNMFYTSMRYTCWRLARQAGAAYVQVHLDCSVVLAVSRNASRQGAGCVPEHVIRHMHHVMETPPVAESQQLGQHGRDVTPVSELAKGSSSRAQVDADGSEFNGAAHAGGGTGSVAGVLHPSGDAPVHRQAGAGAGAACQPKDWQASTLHLAITQDVTIQELASRVWTWLAGSWGAPAPPPYPHEAMLQRRLEGQQANAASLVHAADLESRGMVSAAMKAAAKERRQELAIQLHQARQELLDRIRRAAAAAAQHKHTAVNVAARAAPDTDDEGVRAGLQGSIIAGDDARSFDDQAERCTVAAGDSASPSLTSLTKSTVQQNAVCDSNTCVTSTPHVHETIQHLLLEFADICAAL